MTEAKLPLKRIVIRESDFFRPAGGGSARTVFGDVTTDVRNRVVNELRTVSAAFQTAFSAYPRLAAVARVSLKGEALAKVHRPVRLFDGVGCPIVGVGRFGELLVGVRPSTLSGLENAFLTAHTKDAIADISTIRSIDAFELEEPGLNDLATLLTREKHLAVKVRIFKHGDVATDRAVAEAFLVELEKMHIDVEELAYAASMSVFKLSGAQPEHVPSLARFVGTQSLGIFPTFHVVRPAAQPVGKLTATAFPPPETGVDYPVVGLIDTGVSPANPHLAPWIAGREVFVPENDRDYEHGTFVAGLLVHARSLNHGDERFPDAACRVLDVVALPASGKILEHELLAIIREVVPKYPAIRVWNASLAGSQPCSDHAFSDLAVAIDEIQSAYNVTFVLAAGNYATPPFREWPPTAGFGDADRICGPADSMRGLTVGSIAHRDSPTSRVPATSPSPFSRRGPGPAHAPKPEVSHIGGNCDANGHHAQIGVLSVDAQGNLAESIGTSFATPVVAALLAHVQNRPNEALSNRLAKALVIHSAALSTSELSTHDLRYRGFGVPQDLEDILGCDPWCATLLFDLEIRAGEDLQRERFPIPACLRNVDELFRGKVLATLVYEPPLDAGFGSEYCRTNVNVSLGTYETDGGQHRKVDPFPRPAKSDATEKTLVEHGLKWSPVKVYRREMPRGVAGNNWRLVVDATDRSGGANETIRAALVITVADLDRQASVYNDVVVAMNQLGWVASDVTLRTTMRSRT